MICNIEELKPEELDSGLLSEWASYYNKKTEKNNSLTAQLLEPGYANRFLIAQHRSVQVAFLHFYALNKQCGFLHLLFVKGAARGTGIGNAMLIYYKELMIKEGYRYLETEIMPSNTASISLFIKHGFKSTDNLHYRSNLKDCP